MGCGVPCVATNAGDAAAIVAGNGWIVRRQNPNDLASALEQALVEWSCKPQVWARRKLQCREHVLREYNLGRMVQAYRLLWSGKALQQDRRE
jgi:glycosyltransferase involved in cell wall biosynthesis